MIVTDAITKGRDAEARHAFHQAGCEPAEAAIAERCVGLGAAHLVEIDAEIAERGPDRLGHPQILDDVGEQPPDQEFERHVIDVLAPFGVAGAVDRQPAMHDPVAQGECGRDEPVARGCGVAVLANRQRQFGEHVGLEGVDVLFTRRGVEDRGWQGRLSAA